MRQLRIVFFFCCLLTLLLALQLPQQTQAQEFPSLYDAYPQRGGLGETVRLLLFGDGFKQFSNLDAVLLNGVEMRQLGFEILSNELIEVEMLIPTETPVGVTEIRFVFDDNAYDAYFEVTEGGEGSISPVVTAIRPQEGWPDSEMSLFLELRVLEGDGVPRYEWGEFINLLIGGIEVEVFSISANDPGNVFEYRIYIAPETPLGANEVHLYYQNASFWGEFWINTPNGDQQPVIYGYSPQSGVPGTRLEFILDGDFLTGLGVLNAVEIAGRNMPVANDWIESDQMAVVGVDLPPDLPGGETGIVFFYEDLAYEDTFSINQAGEISIRNLLPREGEIGVEVELILQGENLLQMGDLVRVEIAGMDVPVRYAAVENDRMAVVGVYLPLELPPGDTWIVFYFDRFAHEDRFSLYGGGPQLWGISPQEGRINQDIDLYLDGENLYSLGDLVQVQIGGTGLEVWDYEVEADDELVIYAYLPENTPTGEQEISVSFENASFSESFYVESGIPPWVWAAGAGGALLAGFAVYRIFKPRPPKDTAEKPQKKPLRDYEIRLKPDPGIQIVRSERQSLSLDFDLRFGVQMDPGEQDISGSGESLVKKD